VQKFVLSCHRAPTKDRLEKRIFLRMNNKKTTIIALIFAASVITHSVAHHDQITIDSIDAHTQKITIPITLEAQELLYKNSIMLSVDHPDIILSPWQPSIDPTMHYAPALRDTKPIFNKNFSITVHAESQKPIANAHLNLSYITSKHHSPTQKIVPLNFAPAAEKTNATQKTPVEKKNCLPIMEKIPTKKTSLNILSPYIEQLVSSSQQLWIRMLLVIILGLLMSFTPCIYPMIPITIGIMQGQGSRSLWHNFFHAIAYACGIATTFASFGLIAAASGTLFGSFLSSPFVLLVIIALLIYLAGSLFGFYELYIPRFLQESGQRTHKASVVSSFLFGAVSGSVASPCLSPGLALVLCIVTEIGNLFIGFSLLFAFGIGLSIPLIIVGTFSSSLTLMPRTGPWMVEIKKLFGFLLLGMCFYYLKNIVPWHVIVWGLGLFFAAIGIYYLYALSVHDSKWMKRIKNGIGIISIICAIQLFVEAYQTTFHAQEQIDHFWLSDYELAMTKARQEDKKLFIDFWAPTCSMCTAIDKTILKDATVRKSLSNFIPVKIELDTAHPLTQELKTKFTIIGLPTFIIFDPKIDRVLKRWTSELYQTDKKLFARELLNYS
jgi:thiol:disulfide interchange protein DsbD